MDLDKGYFINKDGEIDEEEYDSWYKIFVIPYRTGTVPIKPVPREIKGQCHDTFNPPFFSLV